MSKSFYITTAIDYLNGEPHLGHAYEKVITDIIVRSRRSFGEDAFFLTGLDEHGQKVQQAALSDGKSPREYCDHLSISWRRLPDTLGLSIDDFIRTTEDRHKRVVQAILSKLYAEDHFYKAAHRGFYSTKEETFLTDKDRRQDGTFDPMWGEVIELVEENYYFKLGVHQKWLIEYIEANPDFIMPSHRRNEVLGFLKNNTLEDLCISRPASRLSWGIPLPFDSDYVTYVWFDALTNYATVPVALGDPRACSPINETLNPPVEVSATETVRHLWPADVHVIGKDILKFHTVYWPIMLKTAGLELPKTVLVHGWWQKDGEKMSKTTGNIVDPVVVIQDWGLDAFRYYVVRELDIGPDGNWTDSGFQSRYQAELANGLGNLINRSLSMLKRYRNGVVPERSDELTDEVNRTVRETGSNLRQFRLQAGLQTIWSLINRVNQYVDQTAPFKLAKDPAQSKRLDEVLYNLAETCRILAVLLWPYLPTTAEKINVQLGLDGLPDRMNLANWGGLKSGHTIGKPEALFPRKDQVSGA